MIRAFQKSQEAEQQDEIGDEELKLLQKEVDNEEPSSSSSETDPEGGDSMEDVDHLTG